MLIPVISQVTFATINVIIGTGTGGTNPSLGNSQDFMGVRNDESSNVIITQNGIVEIVTFNVDWDESAESVTFDSMAFNNVNANDQIEVTIDGTTYVFNNSQGANTTVEELTVDGNSVLWTPSTPITIPKNSVISISQTAATYGIGLTTWDITITQGNLAAENYNDFQFKLTSNPVGNELIINTNQAIESAEIFDILGKLVLRNQTGSKNIDVFYLTKGVYILKLQSKLGFVSTKRIIKN